MKRVTSSGCQGFDRNSALAGKADRLGASPLDVTRSPIQGHRRLTMRASSRPSVSLAIITSVKTIAIREAWS